MGGEDIHWTVFVKFLAFFLFIGAFIYFGSQLVTQSHELKISNCAASYWKARTFGSPTNYCPPGCECDPRFFR